MKIVEHLVQSLVASIPTEATWAVWVLPATPALGVFFCVFVAQVIMRGKYERGLAGHHEREEPYRRRAAP